MKRVLDVASLPPIAHGTRATIYWAVSGLIAIEATAFALLIASYFYLRLEAPTWPPSGTRPPGLLAATFNMTLLALSVVPMALTDRGARRESRGQVAIWLSVSTVLGFGALALRGFEFAALGCRWDSHAYGSIVWTILGMHAFHLVASAIENVLLLALMLRGPIERKHFVDATVNALYWYFVVAAWLPLYVLVFWGPQFL
jgi:heme/copper-type cytochrome/quinol oxidase subunit 3